jgi:hypothetical protein
MPNISARESFAMQNRLDIQAAKAHYNVTPAWTLGAAYTYTDGKFSNAQNSASPKWNQVSLLSDYNLSKRTDLYAVANWSHLSGGLSAQAGSGLAAFEGASSYIGGIAATKNQRSRRSGRAAEQPRAPLRDLSTPVALCARHAFRGLAPCPRSSWSWAHR